ncbi:unnamed protein product [Pedinophyceae sp. YPF-701]|nr:unnamed protein product [Pedinophyceae sp. YPF-701]
MEKAPSMPLAGNKYAPFTVGEGQMGSVGSAALMPAFRLGSGLFCMGYKSELVDDDPTQYAVARPSGKMVKETSIVGTFPRPAQPLVIYEFETCPFCRRVREACSMLDLDVIFYPCPKEGPTFRPECVEKGGKSMFPYLEDPNTGVAMYESADIVDYLFEKYGGGKGTAPGGLNSGLMPFSAMLGLSARGGKGGSYDSAAAGPDRKTMKPVVFYGYEASPFVKVVRERLNELEIPHLYKHAARGSPKRQQIFEEYGAFQVPFIQDPNTNTAMFESTDILAYLDATYGPGAKKQE